MLRGDIYNVEEMSASDWSTVCSGFMYADCAAYDTHCR